MTADTRQLDAMQEAAFGLGMAFAQAATAEDDLDRKLVLSDAFQRCFASVRLSIGLKLRLDREARAALRPEAHRSDTERLDTERLDVDRPEPPERYTERDRDCEAERASFPLLLRTLERVADDAQALLPQAAELPGLRELLDRVKTRPAAAPAPVPAKAAPPTAGPLRARLAGSVATLVPPPPQRLGGLPGIPPRRSTGPPRS